MGVSGRLHGVAPLGDHPHAVFESDGAARRQRAVFTYRMSGDAGGLDAEPLDGIGHEQAEGEGRQLGVARLGQLVEGGVEEQATDVPASSLDASATTSHDG